MIVLFVDQLGQIIATPGALVALAAADTSPSTLLRRHASGDWGDLDAHDRAANVQALRDGVGAQEAGAVAQGVVIGGAVVGVEVAPIAGGVAAQEGRGRGVGGGEGDECPRRSDDLA